LYIAASDPTLYFGCPCKSGSLPLAHNAGHSTSIDTTQTDREELRCYAAMHIQS